MSDYCKQCLNPITDPLDFLLEAKLALNAAKRALKTIEEAQSFEEKHRVGTAVLSVIVTGLESVNANEQWEAYLARSEWVRKELEAKYAEHRGAIKVEVEEYDDAPGYEEVNDILEATTEAMNPPFDTPREALAAVVGLTMDSLSKGGE